MVVQWWSGGCFTSPGQLVITDGIICPSVRDLKLKCSWVNDPNHDPPHDDMIIGNRIKQKKQRKRWSFNPVCPTLETEAAFPTTCSYPRLCHFVFQAVTLYLLTQHTAYVWVNNVQVFLTFLLDYYGSLPDVHTPNVRVISWGQQTTELFVNSRTSWWTCWAQANGAVWAVRDSCSPFSLGRAPVCSSTSRLSSVQEVTRLGPSRLHGAGKWRHHVTSEEERRGLTVSGVFFPAAGNKSPLVKTAVGCVRNRP